jgi:hypothetical protein
MRRGPAGLASLWSGWSHRRFGIIVPGRLGPVKLLHGNRAIRLYSCRGMLGSGQSWARR